MQKLTITHLPEVVSTSDLAADAARDGAPEGMAWRGDIQTGGRGRHGRGWVSEKGNLYISVLLRPDRGQNEWPSLSMMTAVALRDAIATMREAARIKLKWPNDVLLDGKKCAGILLEVVEGAVIIGCGVNCNHAPPVTTGWPAVTLNGNDGDNPITPDAMMERLEISLVSRYKEWRERGFAAMRDDWLAAAAHIGSVVSLDLGGGAIREGVFETIAGDGALCLRGDDGGLAEIRAGDVMRTHIKD